MKFKQLLLFSIIPEWRAFYMDYDSLVQQITLVKESTLSLARSYSRIQDITGIARPIDINIDSLSVEQAFWCMLQENIDKVENFFKIQIKKSLYNFHVLTYHMVRLGYLKTYKPLIKSTTTCLERELERLGLPIPVLITVSDKIDLSQHKEAELLVPITKSSVLEEVLEKMNEKIRKYDRERVKPSSMTDRFEFWESDDELGYIWDKDAMENLIKIEKNKQLKLDPEQNQPVVNWDESSDEEGERDSEHDDGESIRDGVGSARLSSTNYALFSSKELDKSPFPKADISRADYLRIDYQPHRSAGGSGYESTECEEGAGILPQQMPSYKDGMDQSYALPPHSSTSSENARYRVRRDESEPQDKDAIKLPKGKNVGSSMQGLNLVEKAEQASKKGVYGSSQEEDQKFSKIDSKSAKAFSAKDLFSITAKSYVHDLWELPSKGSSGSTETATVLETLWSDFYRGLYLLNRFAILNQEILEKVLKKHDKSIQKGTKHRFIYQNFNLERKQYAFFACTQLKILTAETEHIYAQAFTSGRRTVAMQNLRVSEQKDTGKFSFRFSFCLGLSFIFVCLIIFTGVTSDIRFFYSIMPGFFVFRMIGLLCLYTLFWAIQIHIWTTYRIDFPFIFGLRLRRRALHHRVLQTTSYITFLCTSLMLVYIISELQRQQRAVIPGLRWLAKIPSFAVPLTLFLLLLLNALYNQLRSDVWIIGSLKRVVLTPLFPVSYLDFYTAELLVSSVVMLNDLAFTLCYFLYDAPLGKSTCQSNMTYANIFLTVLPLSWRGLQSVRRWRDTSCSRHLANAGIYGLAIIVSVFSFCSRAFANLGNFWLALWALCLLFLTAFTSYWDVIEDWSLVRIKEGQFSLREQLLYPVHWYYFALATVPILRLYWGMTISLDIVFRSMNTNLLLTLLAVVEIFRRFMWGVLGVEREQIERSDHFKAAVDDMRFFDALETDGKEADYHSISEED